MYNIPPEIHFVIFKFLNIADGLRLAASSRIFDNEYTRPHICYLHQLRALTQKKRYAKLFQMLISQSDICNIYYYLKNESRLERLPGKFFDHYLLKYSILHNKPELNINRYSDTSVDVQCHYRMYNYIDINPRYTIYAIYSIIKNNDLDKYLQMTKNYTVSEAYMEPITKIAVKHNRFEIYDIYLHNTNIPIIAFKYIIRYCYQYKNTEFMRNILIKYPYMMKRLGNCIGNRHSINSKEEYLNLIKDLPEETILKCHRSGTDPIWQIEFGADDLVKRFRYMCDNDIRIIY